MGWVGALSIDTDALAVDMAIEIGCCGELLRRGSDGGWVGWGGDEEKGHIC